MAEFLERFTMEREKNLFTPELEHDLHLLISKFLAENSDIALAQELRGYATLVLINYYRNCYLLIGFSPIIGNILFHLFQSC